MARPKGEATHAKASVIDLPYLMGATSVDEPMFTISLGADFSNDDGLIDQSDMGDIEKRKKGVLEALKRTLRATFREAQEEKLKEHSESLSATKEKVSEKRRRRSTAPTSCS